MLNQLPNKCFLLVLVTMTISNTKFCSLQNLFCDNVIYTQKTDCIISIGLGSWHSSNCLTAGYLSLAPQIPVIHRQTEQAESDFEIKKNTCTAVKSSRTDETRWVKKLNQEKEQSKRLAAIR